MSSAQAQEIYDQAQRGVPRRMLAKQFAVSAQVVTNIVIGRGYSDVVVRSDGRHPDGCPSCQVSVTRDRNCDKARRFHVEVECVLCHVDVPKPVGAVLDSRGLAYCEECARRRK